MGITIAAVTGTAATVAGKAATSGNIRTAPPAGVRIRRKKWMRQNAKGTAAVQTSLVTATAMTTITTVVANTTVVTVVAITVPSGNIHTVLCASAWTRRNSDQDA